MSIVASEMIWRQSETNDDTTNNGGRMTKNAIIDNAKNNLWPDVSQSERSTGSTKYRKSHCHIANDADLQLLQTRVFIETNTPGADAVTIFPGTSTDTEAAISGAEQQYGCGTLDADVLAGVTSITVLTEDFNLAYFKNNMLVRISDMTDVNDVVGKEEYITINAVVTYVGDVATLSFTPALVNGYIAANTRVSSVIQAGTVEALNGTVVATVAGSGTFDSVYLAMDSIGTVEQQWTLTFSDATSFSIVGDILGSVGSGTTSSGATPTNNDYSKPYFTITNTAFAGVFANGDTLVFTTSPAAIPIWQKRTIPAGTASLSNNKVIVGVDGESA